MSVIGTAARMSRKVTRRPASAWASTRSSTKGLKWVWISVLRGSARAIRLVTMMWA
jgi:hypothetical protein